MSGISAHIADFIAATNNLPEDGDELDALLREAGATFRRHLGHPGLSIAVVAEPARQPDSWRDDLLAVMPPEADMSVELLARGATSPRGYDAWVLVIAADQLGSLLEKQFVEHLPATIAEDLLVTITRMTLVPEEEREEILEYARAIFSERGVRPDNVVVVDEGELDAAWEIMRSWQDRASALRTTNLVALLDEVASPLEYHHDELLAYVRHTPDIELCEADEKFLKDSLGAIEEMLEMRVEELHEQLSKRFAEALQSRWEETNTMETPHDRVGSVVQSMNRWLRHDLYEQLDASMNTILDELHGRVSSQSHLLTDVQRARPWVNAHIDAQINLEEIEPLLDDEGFRPGRLFVRVSFPLVGALVGAVLPINRTLGAVTGAGIGVVSGEVVVRLTSKDGEIELPLDHEVTSEFEALSARAIRLTRDHLYELAQAELLQLHERTLNAEDVRLEREAALARLELLGEIRDAMRAAVKASYSNGSRSDSPESAVIGNEEE